MRVLFVDDEPMILKSLALCLRRDRPDWDCTFAPGGEEALRELGRGEFDAVVVDMRMPGMNGAELLSRVRAEHPSAARVVLTGHAEREVMTRALLVADAFLGKPCAVEEIIACIERVRLRATGVTPRPRGRCTPGPRSRAR